VTGFPSKPVFVDAATLADHLNVSRAFVYEHAGELGAIPLGTGPRPRLRFDLEQAMACFTRRESPGPKPTQEAPSRPRRRRSLNTTVELLPVRGRNPGKNTGREAG
jgi:hypothetical protein